eukprot:1080544-Lingulodinium_polyedra.AAC.1
MDALIAFLGQNDIQKPVKFHPSCSQLARQLYDAIAKDAASFKDINAVVDLVTRRVNVVVPTKWVELAKRSLR